MKYLFTAVIFSFLSLGFTLPAQAEYKVCGSISGASQTKVVFMPKGCSNPVRKNYKCYGIVLENAVCSNGDRLGNLIFRIGNPISHAARIEKLLISKLVNKENELKETSHSRGISRFTKVHIKPVLIDFDHPTSLQKLAHSDVSMDVYPAKMKIVTKVLTMIEDEPHLNYHFYGPGFRNGTWIPNPKTAMNPEKYFEMPCLNLDIDSTRIKDFD